MSNDLFLQQMAELLKDEYPLFVESQKYAMYKSLRINPAKTTYLDLINDIELGQLTPFDNNTYYIEEDSRLGKHPFHLAGLFYLQEPSATMAVNALDIQENDYVLDLCAAPGGKSTQILSKLNKTGFLLSNEYDSRRAQTLLSNIERWGNENYMLTNSDVSRLCPQVKGYFDKVLVDAPCSGASMFKKYPLSVKDYTSNNIDYCAIRQFDILAQAYQTLKMNGTLVYSTCTYNLQENEEVIAKFLSKFPDMELVSTNLLAGRKGYDIQGFTRRVFPFEGGEGHFVAKMVKHQVQEQTKVKQLAFSYNKLVENFIQENCNESKNYTIINDRVYTSKEKLRFIENKIVRQAILMGELINNRFEPHHHFFLNDKSIKNTCNLQDRQQADMFIKGLSLPIEGYKGYVQIQYKKIPLGFGKGDGMQIKNHFPKGLRIV